MTKEKERESVRIERQRQREIDRERQREGGRDGLREGGNYITVTYDQKQFNNRSS